MTVQTDPRLAPAAVATIRFLDAEAVRAAGLTYDGIGRPTVGAEG